LGVVEEALIRLWITMWVKVGKQAWPDRERFVRHYRENRSNLKNKYK
jgi:hypothetical protein